jgi:tetratricopeptide (TPR) repeat protein
VIRVFEAAPAEVREMKSVALFRLHAAREIAFAELDSKPLEEAVEAWQKLLTPGSPAAAIHAIEPLMLSGEFEKALEAVEVVDRWAGGDPCLDVFRATIYLRAGELDKARERVDRLVTAAGEFSESHYTRMAVALKQGDHPTVLDELRILRDRFGSQLEPSQEPAFAAFVRSPQFRQWQADSAPE